jgi:hypothetical protein
MPDLLTNKTTGLAPVEILAKNFINHIFINLA